ncbi:MAG: alpha-amylase family glycosyl hydrolase [Fermentimonas sp.]|jgi:glycosidase
MSKKKIFIYQLLPRLFGNTNQSNVGNGSLEDNGCGKFNDINDDILQKLVKQGYTHVWYIGVIAHASMTDYSKYGIYSGNPEIIKGKAGSPYAIRDYYDVDPDLAVDVNNRMQEFESLVERTHKAGLKVIIDNVPNHLAREYKSISKPKGIRDFGETDDSTQDFSINNNFYYLPEEKLEIQVPDERVGEFTYEEYPAKVTGNDCFNSKPTVYNWYETVKLNYGVDYSRGYRTSFYPIPDTWNKMRDVFMYWADKGVDGFRCDMAEMVPLEFWEWVIPQIKAKHVNIIFIAEIYNTSRYRSFLGQHVFDYLYDKVGLYDILRDVSCGYRPSSDITFALNSVGDIQGRLLNFLENHDEQRLASDYFLKDGMKGKAAMILTCCINTNPVMVYFGQELGEKGMDEEGFSGSDGRTTIFDYWSVDTVCRWNNKGKWNNELLTEEEVTLKDFYSRLLSICNTESAIYKGLFYDLMSSNYDNESFDSTKIFAFLRGYENNVLLVICNFDQEEKECKVNIPEHAFSFFGIDKFSKMTMKPLLCKEGKKRIVVNECEDVVVKIGGNSGEIYKLTFK